MQQGNYPNFLFIGPDKTGSSWLFELLKNHPQCFVPECKDIYFFDRYYSRGLDWYLSFFKDASSSQVAIGELSHDYLFSQDALGRIASDLPNAKVLVSLRNPVERSFSHYLYLIRSGMTKLPFREATVAFPEIIEHSLYYKYVSPWINSFGHDSVKVLWFDMLQNDPVKFGQECLNFLGIQEDIDFDFQKKVRAASKPRNYVVAKILKSFANLARRMRMEKVVGRVKHSDWVNYLYKPYTQADKPVLLAQDKVYLLNIFQQDIENLERLLDVNLKHWREG